MRQLMNETTILFTCYFLSSSEVSVVFNISSNANTNLPYRHFPHEISKYLNIHQFYMPCYTPNHTYYDSTYTHFYKNFSQLIFILTSAFIMIQFLL